MVKVNVHEAKANFSYFLQLAQDGIIVVVCKRGQPIVELHPVRPAKKKIRELGLARKHYPNWKPDLSSLLEPMSEKEIKLWEDGPIFPPEQ